MTDFVFRESELERKDKELSRLRAALVQCDRNLDEATEQRDRELARLQLDLAAQAEALRTMRAALVEYDNPLNWLQYTSGRPDRDWWQASHNGWEIASVALAAAAEAMEAKR